MGRPRGSSNLGGDPRGDTSGPAIATLQTHRSDTPPSADDRSSYAHKPHSKRRKAKSLFRRWKSISLRHTWLNPLIIVLAILSAYYVNPGPQNSLHQAIFLSYNQGPDYPGGPNRYGKGKADIAFVSFYTIVLSFTREFLMQRLIRPLAIKAGIRTRAKQSRFMEQFYTAVYFAIFGPFGLYVMKNAEGGTLWYFQTTSMFEGFPHRVHDGIFKAYYLLQAAYWSQQAIVLLLQLEKPRKDFKELVLHHVVTLALIFLSYRFHFAKMGIAVFITHDISDFFLATSKTLNYLDSIIVGPYFAFFIFVWIYLRHYINLHILYATLTEFATVGPYELNWETQQYKCWISQVITFGLLFCLQAVNLFWLFLILRIAKNYVFSHTVQDERSDNEEEEDEPVEQAKIANGDAKKALANETGMGTDKPVLLINGEPVESQAKPEGIKQRRKG
ncbi:sphingosine N-acyltransferase lag1 [Neophaeococcomyces mojaviensis]|uniref:Sphingosine N-acyltransferase lag1 n=1 Tax=Neophaeococcomyces mojaviensis TaxID=3383035 RepID=A0ACC2ZQI9_9EURO|nr:sphingosine N-acyltransferase lag1 [Knufia sp. JES_112]